jgi:uncharacterized protein YndB with AHSA1/START domain
MTSTSEIDTPETTDRIEKHFEVSANRSRVWRAISDSVEFGTWFGMELDRPFVPGATVFGRLTFPGYEHVTLEIQVEKVEPEGYFSYRWHPYPMDPAIDYNVEPTTLVEFRLEQTPGGTAVTITESGFDRLPASRRAEAFRMNEAGWTGQSRKLASYVG